MALALRLHSDFIQKALVMTPDTHLVKVLSEDLNLKAFSGDYNKDLGFEGIFKNKGEKEKFIEYTFPLPQVRKESEEKCTWCNGSGEDSYGDRECFMCSGTGHGFIIDYRETIAASATLTALTKLLKSWEWDNKNTSASLPQLLTVGTITKLDMHGGSLWGEVSSPLRHWLSLHSGHDSIPEATQAMMAAHDKMFTLRDFDKHAFKLMVWEDGALMMDCPGNACGIHPDHHFRGEGEGYEFNCHNVDSSAQQLTLLVGLAAIHDKARKELAQFPG